MFYALYPNFACFMTQHLRNDCWKDFGNEFVNSVSPIAAARPAHTMNASFEPSWSPVFAIRRTGNSYLSIPSACSMLTLQSELLIRMIRNDQNYDISTIILPVKVVSATSTSLLIICHALPCLLDFSQEWTTCTPQSIVKFLRALLRD